MTHGRYADVWIRNEVFPGDRQEHLPDLVVTWNDALPSRLSRRRDSAWSKARARIPAQARTRRAAFCSRGGPASPHQAEAIWWTSLPLSYDFWG